MSPSPEIEAYTESSQAYKDFLEWAATFCETHNIFLDGAHHILVQGKLGATGAREKIDLIIQIADELYDLWADDRKAVNEVQ